MAAQSYICRVCRKARQETRLQSFWKALKHAGKGIALLGNLVNGIGWFLF